MLYLSQLLNKTLYYQKKSFGKIVDMAVSENRPVPPVSKIVVRNSGKKKITIPPSAIMVENNKLVLKTQDLPFLPYDEKDFYLREDLLDKQVIDMDGRRLVRVNDVLLESNGEIKVVGIDVGLSGVFRRLGLGRVISTKTKILPWAIIEAFDYQTGSIKIKLTQNKLNSFHPSEIADILEQVGTKERLGLVEVLDAKKAARTIEELDNQTQMSILEQLAPHPLQEIVNKMKLSEIADVFYKLNPLRTKEISNVLGQEKARNVERLSRFSDDVAGGLMDPYFHQELGTKTVKELLTSLQEQAIRPEAIVVTDETDKLVGVIYARYLINTDPLALLKDIIPHKMFVYPDAGFSRILRLFSQYNLRVLPVVDKNKKIIGIIRIDKILETIEQEEEENEYI